MRFKVGLVQMPVHKEKEANLRTASQGVAEAAAQGAGLVALPEMFCCPYRARLFPLYAEPAGGAAWQALAEMAAGNGVYLVGGTMPERGENGETYNTCFVFDPQGRQIGRHRKVHLFDADLAGGSGFRESDTLTAGSDLTVVETEWGRLGVAVCYDLRFPEQFRLMADKAARMVVVPAAFGQVTGEKHWELLLRCRAVDYQGFVFGASPAVCPGDRFVPYGNSMVVSPWGEILGRLGSEAGVLVREVDLDEAERFRKQLPVLHALRRDLFEVKASNTLGKGEAHVGREPS